VKALPSKTPGPCFKIIHLGIYRDWEELDRLMRNFHVSRAVVDALPETRNARAFAERHKGRVFLNYYNERQKGHYSWNEKELIVQCNRTESMVASHREIRDGSINLPKECEVTRTFAEHMHNAAKRLEEDEETGSKRLYPHLRSTNQVGCQDLFQSEQVDPMASDEGFRRLAETALLPCG
jgi:hypothetical protein